MKTLSLWQPWASALFIPDATGLWLKWFETRSWGTDYRGPLIIHAAKRPIDSWDSVGLDDDMEEVGVDIRTLPLGKALGVVYLVDCIRMKAHLIPTASDRERRWGNWAPGRFAWDLGPRRYPFRVPYETRGRQGIFEFDPPPEIIMPGTFGPENTIGKAQEALPL